MNVSCGVRDELRRRARFTTHCVVLGGILLGSAPIAQATPAFVGSAATSEAVRDDAGHLTRVSGTLRPTDPAAPTQAAGGVAGSFEMLAAPGADLRSAPGSLRIDTSTGSLSALGRSATAPPPAGFGLSLPPYASLPAPDRAVTQSLFTMICASSTGFSTLDPSVCSQNIFSTPSLPLPDPISLMLAPPVSVMAHAAYAGVFGPAVEAAVSPVVLHRNVTADGAVGLAGYDGLAGYLTDEQEALLGCGPLRGTSSSGCGTQTIDLVRADASALLRSFPASGQFGATDEVPPGMRGPWLSDGLTLDSQYDPRIDGCVRDGFDGVAPSGTCSGVRLMNPRTAATFESEVAAVSWNLLQLLVALSLPVAGGLPGLDELDSADLHRLNGCSFLNPGECREVSKLLALAVTPLSDDERASTRWVWELGTEWEVTEATGDLASFAGRTLYGYGPWSDETGGIGLAFVLVPEPASLLLVGLGAGALAWARRRQHGSVRSSAAR